MYWNQTVPTVWYIINLLPLMRNTQGNDMRQSHIIKKDDIVS